MVEVYSTPYEAYDIEIVTDEGTTKGLAEGVRPEQTEVPPQVRFASIHVEADGTRAAGSIWCESLHAHGVACPIEEAEHDDRARLQRSVLVRAFDDEAVCVPPRCVVSAGTTLQPLSLCPNGACSMPTAIQWHFGAFRLDPVHACLWRGEDALVLPPKVFAVLHYLVTNPDRLVTKDELLDAVWPATAVSDAVVRVAIGALRQALGDTAQTSRYIATVPRRGYRFLAPVTARTPAASTTALPAPPASAASLPLLIERDTVLAQLHTHLAQAQQGTRQVVLVSGEPGIGKTAVVEAFAAQAASQGPLWLAQGQCVQSYGVHEAYQPVLEALAPLCRAPAGERLIALLRQHAPTWLVQMPWLLTAADRTHLQQELHGATRERMLREFAELVERLTTETPLLLLLEDLHWSDYATLDLLAALARRRPSARLLVLGTYRPGEALVQGHPLPTVLSALQHQGLATVYPLALLSRTGVAAYLAQRWPARQVPATLAQRLHQHTDGHPLFLVAMAQHLMAQDGFAVDDLAAGYDQALVARGDGVPEDLYPVLDQHLTRLAPAAQHVLEVASVVGVEFAAATVVGGLEASVDDVEAHCEMLVQQQMLRPVGVSTWPDGTVTMRYAFTHALYQQVAYHRLGAGQRLRLHQRVGRQLATAYGTQAVEIAAALAEHCVRGQEPLRAVPYLQQAAENALQRYAPREAIGPLQQALALLTTQPETPARAQQELALQLALGGALVATRGWAAPEVEQTYAQARELCQQVGETTQLFPVLWGLWRFYLARKGVETGLELAHQLFDLAQRAQAPALLLQAHLALGNTLFCHGEFPPARTHLEQGLACYNATQHRHHGRLYGEDPGVFCLARGAQVLWLLGYPDRALQQSQAAITLAQEQSHPLSLALALGLSASIHWKRREGKATQERAEALMALAQEQGFVLRLQEGTMMQSWALAEQGRAAESIAQIRQALAAYEANGVGNMRLYWLVLLADACRHNDDVAEGLRALDEALMVVRKGADRFYEAEVHRLQGVLLLARSAAHHGRAAAGFYRALDMARRQQAKSLELRAATSLARLWQQQGKRAAAHRLLADVYGWFTEGFDTADLQEAQGLLDTL